MAPPSPPWKRRLRIFGGVIGVVGGILAVLGVFAGLRLASIAGDLRQARQHISTASAALHDGRFGDAREDLRQASELLTSANSSLYNRAELDLVSWAPVVGPNLDALRRSVSTGMQLTNGGSTILELARPFESPAGRLEVGMRDGEVPLDALVEAQAELSRLAAVLPGPEERPSSSQLLGPVRSMQATVFDEAISRRQVAADLASALGLLIDMAGREAPRRYLLAIANPAEMRGSGGMVLSYGVLSSEGGRFELTHVGPIDELRIDAPVDNSWLNPPLPADHLQRWEKQQPLQLWRNVNLGPDLQTSAAAMEAMFTVRTGLSVDGVIQIDPIGLAAIVRGIGPVDVPGVGTVTADDLVERTLHRAYLDITDRDERQDTTELVARSVVDALLTRNVDSLAVLAEGLLGAVEGRHVQFVARGADASRALRHFDADGALVGSAVGDWMNLTVQNFSGNKLDYFLDTALHLRGERAAGAGGRVTAEVVVTNPAQAPMGNRTMFGPFDANFVEGQYRGLVSLYLPTGATLVDSRGPSVDGVSSGTEGDVPYVAFTVDLLPGETATIEVDLLLAPRPAGSYSLTYVPSPRVRPTAVSVDLDLGDGSLRYDLGPVDRRVELLPNG